MSEKDRLCLRKELVCSCQNAFLMNVYNFMLRDGNAIRRMSGLVFIQICILNINRDKLSRSISC